MRSMDVRQSLAISMARARRRRTRGAAARAHGRDGPLGIRARDPGRVLPADRPGADRSSMPAWRTSRSGPGRLRAALHGGARAAAAVVGGNSLGGHVALELALTQPGWVAGLILTGSSGLFERTFTRRVPHRPTAGTCARGWRRSSTTRPWSRRNGSSRSAASSPRGATALRVLHVGARGQAP